MFKLKVINKEKNFIVKPVISISYKLINTRTNYTRLMIVFKLKKNHLIKKNYENMIFATLNYFVV